MAYVDELKRGTDSGLLFVGSFASGAEVRWGTRSIAWNGTLPGLVEPRMLDVPSFSYGIGETWDAELEVPSVSITLDNADGALGPYVIGCALGAVAASEYSGDSFLNLRGLFYHWTRRAGQSTFRQVSPYMYCTRGPSASSARTTLHFSARGASDLTRSKYGAITVRHLLDSDAGAHASGTLSAQYPFHPTHASSWSSGAASAVTQGTFTAILEALEGGEKCDPDRVVPFIFGRNAFRTIPVGSVAGMPYAIIGITASESLVDAVASWAACTEDGRLFRESQNFPYAIGQVGQIRRDVTCDDGTVRAVWILYFAGRTRAAIGESGNGPIDEPPEIIIPGPTNPLGLGTTAAAYGGPASLIEQIAEDLAPSTLAVTSADFATARASQWRAHRRAWGGSIYGAVPLDEPISVVAGAGHTAVWLDRTGSLRCLAYPGWSATETAAALTALPIVRDDDLLGDDPLEEVTPVDENQRGAAASRISIAWTKEQAAAFPARNRNDRVLGGYAPGVNGTEIAAELDGSWIYPPASIGPLNAAALHRSRFSRRIYLTTRLWVGAAYDPPQLFRLQLTFGRGGAGRTQGYSNRLVRLEHVDLDFAQNAARCRFEDLGPVEALRPCVLDDEANWIRFDPSDAAPADNIKINAGSATIDATNWSPSGVGVAAGDSLWTFGAANAANRRSLKILTVGAASFTVEANGAVGETITCSAAGTALVDRAWIIMKSQSTKAPTNTEKLTLCDESTRAFRGGSPAGFVAGS